jgi:adenylate cyclase
VRVLRERQGRPFGLVVLAGLLALAAAPDFPARQVLRFAAFDAYHALAPRVPVSAPAVIVEIDEASLAQHGRWPWPRTLLARLVQRIAAGDPAAIGIDIVMPEPDRLSPPRLPLLVPDLPAEVVERLARLPSSDTVLADTLRPLPVVLGVAGLPKDALVVGAVGSVGRRPPVRIRGGDPRLFVRRFDGALRSIELIDAAAAGHGLINPELDRGVVRRMPLVAAVGEALVPTLGVEMLRLASGAPGLMVDVGLRGVEAVRIGDLAIRTQPDGSVWLRFARDDPGRLVSAAEVLAEAVSPERFARRLVLVGVTAIVGLSDHHVTPVADLMPGVEIQAQLLEAIYEGALLSRPWWMAWLEAVVLALAGGLLIGAIPAVRVAWGAALGATLLALILTLGFVLYRSHGSLFDAASPALGVALVFAAMLGITRAEADRQRRALREALVREREAAARLAADLEAARRIQRGILPEAAGAFPDERRFSLHAWIEPARMVGGDLYDFFLLDRDRLFFLIGDVSGKGLPASLFMALSKSLLRSAAQRGRVDLGTLWREANTEISRNNAEALFVSVVGGVLDVATGSVSYCNAGHEPPYVLHAAEPSPRRLKDQGGPPLCVLEDFPYAAASTRLGPGETLCLVTDGIPEARRDDGELYGRARLEDLLARLGPTATADGVGEAIRRDVERFVGNAEPADDMAILVVRWNGSESSAAKPPPGAEHPDVGDHA